MKVKIIITFFRDIIKSIKIKNYLPNLYIIKMKKIVKNYIFYKYIKIYYFLYKIKYQFLLFNFYNIFLKFKLYIFKLINYFYFQE